MTAPLLNVIMIGIIALIATEIVLYWHVRTKGTWREWPAGRSLMYLLLIIAVGFSFGIVNQFLGQYAARVWVGGFLYGGFISALIIIRFTIRAEMKRGERKLLQTKLPTTTGPVDITVATKNEETPNV
jgi:hypothetical protein